MDMWDYTVPLTTVDLRELFGSRALSHAQLIALNEFGVDIS